jgi:hypothetical protein
MRIKPLLTLLLISTFFMTLSHARTAPVAGASNSPVQAAKPDCLCYPQPARNVGVLLLRSNPLMEMDAARFNAFREFIQQNAALLRAGTATMNCAGQLGRALQQHGLTRYSPREYDEAYGRVLQRGGTIEMANDVADSMRSGALDAWMTGKELVWLSQVIPAAANGNWLPYATTGTESRKQLRQVMVIIEQMPDMQGMLNSVQHLLVTFQPQIEEQMVMAACLLRR